MSDESATTMSRERLKAAFFAKSDCSRRYPADGRCDACGQPNRRGRRLAWDHDHVTNEFRGWLCMNCNIILGHAGDSTERLRKLISYLEGSK